MIGFLIVGFILLLLVLGVTFMIVGLVKVNRNSVTKKSSIFYLMSGSALTTLFVSIVVVSFIMIYLTMYVNKNEQHYVQKASMDLQAAQKTHSLSDINKAILNIKKSLAFKHPDKVANDIRLIEKAELLKEQIVADKQK